MGFGVAGLGLGVVVYALATVHHCGVVAVEDLGDGDVREAAVLDEHPHGDLPGV